VKSRKQAIAIGLSEGPQEGQKKCRSAARPRKKTLALCSSLRLSMATNSRVSGKGPPQSGAFGRKLIALPAKVRKGQPPVVPRPARDESAAPGRAARSLVARGNPPSPTRRSDTSPFALKGAPGPSDPPGRSFHKSEVALQATCDLALWSRLWTTVDMAGCRPGLLPEINEWSVGAVNRVLGAAALS